MKLKCEKVIADFKDAVEAGKFYNASDLKYDICDVVGDRPKRHGSTWTGVFSLGKVVVLGVAKFSILEEDSDEDSE